MEIQIHFKKKGQEVNKKQGKFGAWNIWNENEKKLKVYLDSKKNRCILFTRECFKKLFGKKIMLIKSGQCFEVEFHFFESLPSINYYRTRKLNKEIKKEAQKREEFAKKRKEHKVSRSSFHGFFFYSTSKSSPKLLDAT